MLGTMPDRSKITIALMSRLPFFFGKGYYVILRFTKSWTLVVLQGLDYLF